MMLPWKFKSFVFGLIDRFNGHKLLYFLQTHVTKTANFSIMEIDPIWRRHFLAINKHSACELVFEFGVGKYLGQNIYLSSIVQRQLLYDLNRMINFRLVDRSRFLLSGQCQLRSDEEISDEKDLLKYGIEYCAPADARKVALASNSVSACISTNTFEHIPESDLRSILRELFRLLKPGGIISTQIDYSDHYAYTDPSIHRLNFLKFNNDDWNRYNHGSHFQNRLRHAQYRDMFVEEGFVVVDEETYYEWDADDELLCKIYQREDISWCATSGYFVLLKLE